VDSRDYTIPRPQLKVGKIDFIDTYSPFWTFSSLLKDHTRSAILDNISFYVVYHGFV
jgi:hypothetical protein